MNSKVFLIVAICAAVIGAGVTGAIMAKNKAAAAQAAADEAQANADEAAANAKAADKEAAAEAEKRRAAEADQKAKADELEAAKVAREKAEIDARAAADNKAAAEAAAKEAEANAEAARAARDAARRKAEQAKAEADKAKEEAKAAAAKEAEAALALEAERTRSEKTIAEAKLLELRKIDFETLARDLAEWKTDLEERERALKPEKTVSDLSWAGGKEDTVFDEKGNVKKQEKVVYDPEKDMSLPAGTRRLVRAERLAGEDLAKRAEKVRDSLVSTLDGLRRQALAEGRVIDADFYGKSIESLYPGWKPDAADTSQKNKENKEEEFYVL